LPNLVDGELFAPPPVPCEGSFVPRVDGIVKIFPLPADQTATITYSLKEASFVTMTLYDVTGRVVRRILQEEFVPFVTGDIRLDTSTLPSGVYYLRLTTRQDQSQRFVLDLDEIMVQGRDIKRLLVVH